MVPVTKHKILVNSESIFIYDLSVSFIKKKGKTEIKFITKQNKKKNVQPY